MARRPYFMVPSGWNEPERELNWTRARWATIGKLRQSIPIRSRRGKIASWTLLVRSVYTRGNENRPTEYTFGASARLFIYAGPSSMIYKTNRSFYISTRTCVRRYADLYFWNALQIKWLRASVRDIYLLARFIPDAIIRTNILGARRRNVMTKFLFHWKWKSPGRWKRPGAMLPIEPWKVWKI